MFNSRRVKPPTLKKGSTRSRTTYNARRITAQNLHLVKNRSNLNSRLPKHFQYKKIRIRSDFLVIPNDFHFKARLFIAFTDSKCSWANEFLSKFTNYHLTLIIDTYHIFLQWKTYLKTYRKCSFLMSTLASSYFSSLISSWMVGIKVPTSTMVSTSSTEATLGGAVSHSSSCLFHLLEGITTHGTYCLWGDGNINKEFRFKVSFIL